MADNDLIQALNRIAAAIERLAPPPVIVPEPCVRCDGQGWLGHPTQPCHACNGTGRQPTT